MNKLTTIARQRSSTREDTEKSTTETDQLPNAIHVVICYYFERFKDVAFALDAELNVIESLRSGRRVVDVLALDERHHFAGEQARYGAFDARALHFALQFVEQHPQELLDMNMTHFSK